MRSESQKEKIKKSKQGLGKHDDINKSNWTDVAGDEG